MGGIAPGRTGRRCNSVLIGMRQPLNVFGIAAAAGAGVGSDTICCAGSFSCYLGGIVMGMSFNELVQFLFLCRSANCAGALGQTLSRSGRLFRNNPVAPSMASGRPEVILIAVPTGAGVGGIALGGASGICGLFGVLVDVVQGNILHIDPAIGNASPYRSINGALLEDLNNTSSF